MVMFKKIADVYEILRVTDCYSSLPKEIINLATKFTLKFYLEKYGKDDYRYREIFALSQASDFWENVESFRALVHSEVIGSPHGVIELKSTFDHCTHCEYLCRLYKKWNIKLQNNIPENNIPIMNENGI
jgi:hypothetical protein